jgi:hypothetical protein
LCKISILRKITFDDSKMKKLFIISVVILLIFIIHSCKKDKPTPPKLTTVATSEISYTTATSGGEVTDIGGAPILSRGVCWNTSADPTITNSKTTESGDLGSFTSKLTQLTLNTLYYIRAYATNKAGTGYGDQISFTTLQVEVPVLTTTAITSITSTTAISGGNITNDNGGSVTDRGVCWSTSQNPTVANSKSTDGTGTGVFTSSITGLVGNTTYYVRAYATNSVGTGYGNNLIFGTHDLFPLKVGNEFYYHISGSWLETDGIAMVTKITSLKGTIKRTIIKELMQNNTTEYSFEDKLNGIETIKWAYNYSLPRYDTTIYKDKISKTFNIIEDHQSSVLSGGILETKTFKRYQNVPEVAIYVNNNKMLVFDADLGITKDSASGYGNGSSYKTVWLQDSVKIFH